MFLVNFPVEIRLFVENIHSKAVGYSEPTFAPGNNFIFKKNHGFAWGLPFCCEINPTAGITPSKPPVKRSASLFDSPTHCVKWATFYFSSSHPYLGSSPSRKESCGHDTRIGPCLSIPPLKNDLVNQQRGFFTDISATRGNSRCRMT